MKKTALVCIAMAAAAFSVPAEAGSVTRQGPNGGQFTRGTACAGTVAAGQCATDWAYTNPSGAHWSGQRRTSVGPWRGLRQNSVTGPNGNTVQRGRVWRR